MIELKALLELQVLGNSAWQWGLAFLVLLATFTVLPLLGRYLGALRRRQPTGATQTMADVVALLARHTTRLFLWSVFAWLARLILFLPPRLDRVLGYAITVMLWIQVGIWLTATARYFIERREGRTSDPSQSASLTIVQFIVRLAIWSLVLLVALDNLGVNVTALITGLGIGGIAVALSVQTVLRDLLASLSIAFDKPFAVGDVLAIGQDTGRVEQIGISNTRLRSLSGEQLIISNADLLSSRVHNFGRMFERRVFFSLGIAYDTPREKLRRIPGIIEAAVRAQEKTRFERSHFSAFGDSALVFETVYFILGADYLLYADIQQAINFRLHEEFEALGVQLAYRSQRLVLEGTSVVPPRADAR